MQGRKDVTRRLMNPQPEILRNGIPYANHVRVSPRYLPGETVYIKEAWRIGAWKEDGQCVAIDYRADGFARKEWLLVPDEEMFDRFWIQSTDDAIKAGLKMDCDCQYHWEPGQSPCRWRSPRFMPEWAARSKALIVSVRPERVQEITDEEISKEGIDVTFHAGDIATAFVDLPKKRRHSTARECFRSLWHTLHPGSWERNDFVFRYELRKV